VDGNPWPDFFDNASDFALSPCGAHSAAAVQTRAMEAADIQTFQQGCYSVAVDGKAWGENYVNVWTPVFDESGEHVAAQVRRSLYDYTIVVDGVPWSRNFLSVWAPAFHPKTGAVVAPVRSEGKWGLAENGTLIWPARYTQLWQQAYDRTGSALAAIVATSYGRFTVSVNDRPWQKTFGVVTDLAVHPDGKHVGALGKEADAWTVIVNGRPWAGAYDMVYPLSFSPDGSHAALRAEKNGKFVIALDGKEYKETFDRAWDPIFSPEGDKVLIRGTQGEDYFRIVAGIQEF
jgi:hypothetical protein